MKFFLGLTIFSYLIAVALRINYYIRGKGTLWPLISAGILSVVLHGAFLVNELHFGSEKGFAVGMTLGVGGFFLALICLGIEMVYSEVYFSVLGFPAVIPLLLFGSWGGQLLEGPGYQGPHFFAHIFSAVSGEVFFLLAGISGFSYLSLVNKLKEKNRLRATFRLPPLTRLDRLTWRFSSLGFFFFSAGLILGFFWSHKSFGVVPLTGLTQIISAIVWGIYAAMFLGRFGGGWAGPRIAWLAIFGCCAGMGLVLVGLISPHWSP